MPGILRSSTGELVSVFIRIHPADDVVIAKQQLVGGTRGWRAKASPWPA